MTTFNLVKEVANKLHKTPYEVREVLGTSIDLVTKTLLDGDKVQLYGFGTFTVKTRKEREGHDFRTGEAIPIPESKHVHFNQSKVIKKLLNPGDVDG